MRRLLVALAALAAVATTAAAQSVDLAALASRGGLRAVNRAFTLVDAGAPGGARYVRLAERTDAGIVWLDGVEVAEGTIELDVRGRDVLQRSFLGVAFHGVNDGTFDAVYLRPFNFRAADSTRHAHAVQYISLPGHDWSRLRQERPGEFERAVEPPPAPDAWVHLRVELRGSRVRVWVGDGDAPDLEVERLSAQGRGRVGLWAGAGSPGDFANLRVMSTASGTQSVYFDRAHGEFGPPAMDTVAARAGLAVTYATQPLTAEALRGHRVLYLRAPPRAFAAPEKAAVVDFVRRGGSLLLVLDQEERQSLAVTGVNDLIAPFGMRLTADTPRVPNGGAVAAAGEINAADRELPFDGGRAVEGGAPFAWQLDSAGRRGPRNDERRYLLATLLTFGFKAFKLDTLDPLPDTSPLFADQIAEDAQPRQLKIGYRGDDRQWSEIDGKGGFQRRVDAQDQAQSLGLWEGWHPFSRQEFRECLWFRRGRTNIDNCLNTVVSVSNDFVATLRFPKLNDPTRYPTINVTGVGDTAYAQWPANVALPAGISRAQHPTLHTQVLKSTIYIYVFKANGIKMFDTLAEQVREKGTPYTERGAEKVPADHILARVKVDRYHADGLSGYDPSYLDVSGVEYTPNDESALKGKLYGSDELVAKFKQHITKLRSIHSLTAREDAIDAGRRSAQTAELAGLAKQRRYLNGQWLIKQGIRWVPDPDQSGDPP